jgi:hypothetical protein
VKRSVGYSLSPTQSSREAVDGRIGYALDSPSAELADELQDEEEEDDFSLPTVRTLTQAYAG